MGVRPLRCAVATDEAGMTLVEVMVAMLMLTVVLSALASVLTTSLHSLHGNENRVRANALASSVIEDLQERRWDFVGFAQDAEDDDYEALSTDAPEGTVIVDSTNVNTDDYDEWKAQGDTDWDASGRVLPKMTATRDNITYTIETRILWEADGATGTDHDYKQLEVAVSWEEFGTSRSTEHHAQRTPSSSEQEGGLTIRSITITPSWKELLEEEADPDDDKPGWREVSTSIDVNVRMSGTYDDIPDLEIHFPDDSIDQSPSLAATNPPEYTAQLTDFETLHGETTFRVTAEQDGQTAEKSTVAQYVYPDVIIEDPPRLSPSDVCTDPDNDYRLTGDLEVTMDVTGLLADDAVTVTTHGGDGESFEAGYQGPATTEAEHIGSEFAATLPEGLGTGDGGENKPRLRIDALREFDALDASHVLVSIDECS